MKKLYSLAFLSASVFLSACVGFNAAGEVQSGRHALLTGRPKVALGHFQRAADINPRIDYVLSPLDQSIWTYIGRAYYDAGNIPEARKTLEKANSLSKNDYMAALYLGLTLTKNGDRERGLSDMESGLNGMRNWLDNMERYDSDGRFWDSTGELRSKIQEQLASISGKEFHWPELIANGEWLGQQMEEEIDLARMLKRREDTRDGENKDGDQ